VKRGSVKSSKNSNFGFWTQNEGQATVIPTKLFSDDSHNAISSCDQLHEEFALKGTTGKDAPEDIHWYLDSGCTCHMTNNETIVYDKFPQNVEVSGAVNGPPILGKQAGKVKLFPIIDNHVSSITLENVLVVDIRKNLISVKQICACGGKVEFYEKFAAVYYNSNIVMVAKLVDNGLFEVQLNHTKEEIHMANIDVWHER